MAHVRKDTFTTPGEWAKHLRKFGKRRQARADRKAARRLAAAQQIDIAELP